MKRIMTIVYYIIVVVGFYGCSPVTQIAYSVGVPLAAQVVGRIHTYEYRWLQEGKEIERHQVGKYEVRVSDGRADDVNYIFFSVYDIEDSGNPKVGATKRLSFRKDKKEDMQIYDEYSKTGTINKKKFIKELFIKYVNFDLGPVEEPKTAEKSPKETVVSKP